MLIVVPLNCFHGSPPPPPPWLPVGVWDSPPQPGRARSAAVPAAPARNLRRGKGLDDTVMLITSMCANEHPEHSRSPIRRQHSEQDFAERTLNAASLTRFESRQGLLRRSSPWDGAGKPETGTAVRYLKPAIRARDHDVIQVSGLGGGTMEHQNETLTPKFGIAVTADLSLDRHFRASSFNGEPGPVTSPSQGGEAESVVLLQHRVMHAVRCGHEYMQFDDVGMKVAG